MVHASLFSGIGGPEVAAEMLGWENAFHCEINPFGKAILEYWFPNSVSYEDITKTDFREWRGKIDVLTGGFPCQPFSYAGKRGGREDERYLWPQMLRAIDEVRPTWVVGENVAGLATMVEGGVLSHLGSETTLFGEGDEIHGYLLRETFTIERICRDLERIGYSVQPTLIPAAAVGAPHRRDRIFIIAYNAANTDSGRLEGTSERRRKGAGDDAVRDNRICSEIANAANTYGERREEPQQPGREENRKKEGAGMDDRTERPRHNGTSSDSFRKRLEAAIQRRGDGEEGWDCSGRYAKFTSDDAWSQGTWWDNFPIVSPVCGRYDGFSSNVVRYINDKVYDELKEHFRNEDLSSVWQVFQSPQVRQTLGRLYKIHETDLLLKVVFGAQTGRRPKSDGDGLSARSDEVSERVLRKLRKQGASSRASQRLQHQEQLARELGYALPALSFDLALAAKTIEEEVLRMMSYVRTESIKAYGNAICPQVMYEIFRAIEEVSK